MSRPSEEVFLVTGSMGCLGVWVLHHLVKQGRRAIGFDLSKNTHRLDLLLSPEEQQAITFVSGDLTDFAQVQDVLERHRVTHIVHLAALQVPFCKADPVKGAHVNVVGTVNVFEAARQAGLHHLAYASSLAVYGPRERYESTIVPVDAPLDPRTLYGVYKQANEGTARIYWQDHQLSSVALRPYTVYGVGRDQGLTSEPTQAMLAAAAGKSFHISFGGSMQFHFASDVALHFIEAAETNTPGALAFNLGGTPIAMPTIIEHIQRVRPGVAITYEEKALPFPDGVDAGDLGDHLPKTQYTPLEEGIRSTIEHFSACLTNGSLPT